MTIFCLLGNVWVLFFFFSPPVDVRQEGETFDCENSSCALELSGDDTRERERERREMGGCHGGTLARARWHGAGINAALQQPHRNSENRGQGVTLSVSLPF